MIGAAEFCVPTQVDTPVENLPTTTAARPIGRPRIYNHDIAYEICERLGNGAKLHDICKDEHIPHAATVYRWVAENHQFRAAYYCALLAKFDMRSEECVAIADDASKDYELEDDADGTPTLKPAKETIARTELRIKTRQWQMAKELPRKYAEMAALQAPDMPNSPHVPGGENAHVVGEQAPAPTPDDPVEEAMTRYIEQDAAQK